MACAQASLWGANDGNGHSLVYYFGLPEGWDPAMVGNKAALGLLQRFVHDGTEEDGCALAPCLAVSHSSALHMSLRSCGVL